MEIKNTCLLVIDVKNTYLKNPAPKEESTIKEKQRYDAWQPFHQRMHEIVIPNIKHLEEICRTLKIPVIFTRIACLIQDGRDRSLSQKMQGWNNLLMPHNEQDSAIIPELSPLPKEIVLCKTTDSALTGTNLRFILNNMGIKYVICTGIFTDQCISSTVRSLADESFLPIIPEDACAAGTMELHKAELAILNYIYGQVTSTSLISQALKNLKNKLAH